jgi:hypothetical protein
METLMKRQEMERAIAQRIIADAIAAGFSLDVLDGEDYPLKNSTDPEAIINAMFSTDDDRLYFNKDGQSVGWVHLLYGENGWDVVSDHTANLDDVLRGAEVLADLLEGSNATATIKA